MKAKLVKESLDELWLPGGYHIDMDSDDWEGPEDIIISRIHEIYETLKKELSEWKIPDEVLKRVASPVYRMEVLKSINYLNDRLAKYNVPIELLKKIIANFKILKYK